MKHGAANKGRDADTAPQNMTEGIVYRGRQHIVSIVMGITKQGPKSVCKGGSPAPSNNGTPPSIAVEHIQVQARMEALINDTKTQHLDILLIQEPLALWNHKQVQHQRMALLPAHL